MGCLETKPGDGNQYDHLFKLVIVGNLGVGKSSIILRYCENNFTGEEIATIGEDFKIKFLDINKRRIKLQIWDTAGQEKFRQITVSYYRGAQGVIIVFDLANRSSFEEVGTWVKEAKVYVGNNTRFLIVGNKSDQERVVSREEAKALVSQLNEESSEEYLYIETSAKDNQKIAEAFNLIAKQLLDDETGDNRL